VVKDSDAIQIGSARRGRCMYRSLISDNGYSCDLFAGADLGGLKYARVLALRQYYVLQVRSRTSANFIENHIILIVRALPDL
jgi:hypothetical protein